MGGKQTKVEPWQIVPTVLVEMLRDKDPAKSARVMKAMMKMIKLDVATLKSAYTELRPAE